MRNTFLLVSLLFIFSANAQQNNSILLQQPVDNILFRRPVTNPPVGIGPKNNHAAFKTTVGGPYSDWYDLWDEMYDTSSTTLPHSYQFLWALYPDSNIYDNSGIYAPYYIFTHGLGMSFDPSDSAYYYHAFNPAYRVSAPFNFRYSYQLDSFWIPGIYERYDTTSANVDSLIIEFIVTQNGGTPDSGAYSLIFAADTNFHHSTPDQTPRFATSRYFRLADECIDPVLTKVHYQRYAFPLTAATAFATAITKFNLTTPLTVPTNKYLVAYVYFKSQVAYPLGTTSITANDYWLYAGEPIGVSTWFPQSAHNSIGYTGSRQAGLIATNQVRYNDLGYTFGGHNVLIPNYAWAPVVSHVPPGFSVPHMAFHITWTTPPPAYTSAEISANTVVSVFPNPATDVLNIGFTLDQNRHVKVSLVNTLGQTVATREMGVLSSGKAVFNIAGLPAGVYLYVLEADGMRSTGRVLIAH